MELKGIGNRVFGSEVRTVLKSLEYDKLMKLIEGKLKRGPRKVQCEGLIIIHSKVPHVYEEIKSLFSKDEFEILERKVEEYLEGKSKEKSVKNASENLLNALRAL